MAKFPNIIRKAITAAAILAGTQMVSANPALAASAWTANDDDSLLLDVRSGKWRVGDGVRGYQTPGGVCVDLADTIIALDIPMRLDKKSRRATGWLFAESRTITVDREQNIVQIVNKSTPLSSNDIYDTPEGWCVNTKTLASWLAVEVIPDLTNSMLVLKSETKLPFEMAEERKERAGKLKPKAKFDLAKLPQGGEAYQLWRMPSVDVVASAGVQKNKLRGATFDARYEIYASGEIAGASFDARLSSNRSAVPETLRVKAYRTDPNAKLLGPLHATHFAVGDVSTESTALGASNSIGRGAYVTNRPVERPENFDRTSFRGELPDGWDAELYRNDQLLGFSQSRGDGRYEFLDIPLLFGQNRMEVVLYGPQGQVRRDVRLIPVGLDSIPPRETYYWAGILESGRDLIDFGEQNSIARQGWRGGFGLERGLNSRTSVAASFSSFMFGGVRRQFLEGAIRRSLGPALAELTGATNFKGGFATRLQALGQFGETRFSGEAVMLRNGYQSERYVADLRHSFAASIDQNIKLGKTSLPIRAEALFQKFVNGRSTLEASANTTFNINRLSIATGITWQEQHQGSGSDPPANVEASLRLSGRLGRVRLRGETRFALTNDKGFRDTILTAEMRTSEKAEWRADFGYNPQSDRGRLSLGYTRKFKHFALTGQIEGATDGGVAAGLNLAFSIGPDPRGGFRVASDKLASSGQVLAVVFHDRNGDGIRQEDEPTEEAVEITAGAKGHSSPTDAKGASFVDNLQPFKPILIGIDASTLPDPFIQPAHPGIVVIPRPGIVQIVELPLVSAGEISGALQRDDGKPVSGVDIELLDKNGNIIKTVRSEYDGYFLFESVPYGRYNLRISALAANIVGIEARLTQVAELSNGKPVAELGVIIAKAAIRIAEASVP
jgi:Carboxypeptidase regulatory-like domain